MFIQSINHLCRQTHIVNTYHLKIPSLEKMQNNSIQHNANDIDFEQMLIKALTQNIKIKKMQPCLIIKTKFIVQLAAAKTIHQAQGLTMDELLFHPTDVPYATLSHICTEEKLHFSAPLHFYLDNFHITIKRNGKIIKQHIIATSHSQFIKSHVIVQALKRNSLHQHFQGILSDCNLQTSHILSHGKHNPTFFN